MTANPRVGVGLVCVWLLLTGCTRSVTGEGPTTTGATERPGVERECQPPVSSARVEVAVFGTEQRDLDMISFDGTRIRLHWFPHPGATPTRPAPTVLMGPGWSLAGSVDIDQPSVLGSIDIRSLREAGYNVLTWDPRGFGESDGVATVNSASNEGRDVQQMIEWVATVPGVQLDAERDPRMGMVGGSYGGGIQLVAAAIDCRVDAIVPIVAWHSLRSSLFKADTVKIGWARVLSDAAATNEVDPHVVSARQSAVRTGTLSDEDLEWFVDRGPGDLVADIRAPTLLIHGTIDTLFTLDEAVTNYETLAANKVPVAMLWNCDGHGVCLTDKGDPTRASRAAITWLNRYVKSDESVDPGPGFDTIDQNGRRFVADRYRRNMNQYLSARGEGTLALVAEGGAGPVPPESVQGQLLAGIASDLTPSRADNAVNVTLTADRDAMLLGAPEVEIHYKGVSASGNGSPRPQRVFAQLVDETSGLVIGNQITPIAVTLDGREHTTKVPLELISFSVTRGSKLTLQLVANTVAYLSPSLGGTVDFSEVELRLPVANWLEPVS